MKIVKITMFKADVGFGDTTYKTVGAKSHSTLDATLLRIDTDEGISGWGEITPWGRTYLPEFTEAARSGIDIIGPHLINQDPSDLQSIHAHMTMHLNGHAYIKSAVDIACWDILARRANVPVYKLLGGSGCAEIPMNCAVYNGTFDDMHERIQGYRENGGYRIFSTKPSGKASDDVNLYEKLAGIRKDDEIFIADANRLWTITDALKVAKHIEKLGYNIEQPCETYESCLRVRRATNATFTLDESITDHDVLARAAKDNAADIIHLKLSRIGGLSAAARFSAFCQISGLSLSWASSGGTEIAYMASLHAAAATPQANLFGLWNCREFNVETYASGAPEMHDGFVKPTDAIGLGIEVDEGLLGEPIASYQ